MNRVYILIAALVFGAATMMAQDNHIAEGLATVATIAGETHVTEDSALATVPVVEVPLWKKKLYYGYNFDIYFHHDSKDSKKENGWSIALTPEIGWRLKDKYSEDIRVMLGSWEVTPYARYRLKTLFNGKVGIWIEGHLYTGMEFPRVTEGSVKGTDYDGLKHCLTYGLQVSPVITYQFNRKSTFQIFFSILSLGYSGTTRFYNDNAPDGRHNEYSNDVIIFSGKLSNLIANQFTPGLYGLKFGVQRSF